MKKINEEEFQELIDWLSKEHPVKYKKYLDNIQLIRGDIIVNERNNISFTERQILIRILEHRTPHFE